MRCQFCNWDNPQGRDKCEKCNRPLQSSNTPSSHGPESHNAADNHARPTDRQAAGATGLRKTVREQPVEASAPKQQEECPECGYPLENGTCPLCGYPAETAETPSEQSSEQPHPSERVRKTVRPNRKGEKEGTFTLTPISEETGEPEGDAIPFEGNSVSLNRDNTDPKNSTITSQEQAHLTCENGQWMVEDKSEYKTTFVQAARKIALQHGDLILLGSQLYRFNT